MNTAGTTYASFRIVYYILMVDSLADAHVQANDDKDKCFNSTLPGLLKKCEKLQLRVQVRSS